MHHRGYNLYGLGVWMGAILLFGCATGPSVREDLPVPPWQLMSSGAYETSHGRAFYGIGVAEGSRNTTLLRATAINRAGKELVDVLDRYVAELFRVTQTIPAPTGEDGQQLIGDLVRDAMVLSVISDQKYDPAKGQLYVLCRLDLVAFKQVLAAQTTIAPDVRGAMAGAAENVHAIMVQPDK